MSLFGSRLETAHLDVPRQGAVEVFVRGVAMFWRVRSRISDMSSSWNRVWRVRSRISDMISGRNRVWRVRARK